MGQYRGEGMHDEGEEKKEGGRALTEPMRDHRLWTTQSAKRTDSFSQECLSVPLYSDLAATRIERPI